MSELALPDGWNSDSLETFLSFALGGDWGKPADYDDPEFETVYCIRGTEISHWAKTNGSTAVERKIKATSLEKRKLQEGDILVEISGGGPDQPVGRTVVIEKKVLNKFKTDNIICTNFLRMFRPTKFINPKFLNFYLQMFYSSGYINEYQSGSNNLRNLKFKEFLTIDVPFAPIDEQNAIVSELEKYFEIVSQIQARLDAIPKLIEKFRQSVLNDAVSGKLTEEWRTYNGQAEIIEALSITSKERAEVFGSKYKKPISLKIQPKNKLPDSWTWVSIDSACKKITDGTHHSPESFVEGEYKYITSKNVRNGYMDLSNITYVDEKTHKEIYSRCDVEINDVLLVKDGANTGLCCVNTLNEEFSLLSSVGVLKTSSFLNPYYLQFYFWSPIARKYILNTMGGTAIKRLTLTKIKSLPLTLPPKDEQDEIVRQINELFANTNQIEKSVAIAKARVDNLTQSILHQAFTGQLTKEWREQNPELISGDNSAEALLAKIEAEKQGSSKKNLVRDR